MSNPIRATPVYVFPDDAPVITADFTGHLNKGIEDWITSVGTAVDTDAVLAITGEAVNTTTTALDDGTRIAPKKSVQFQVTAGFVASSTHYVKIPITLENNSNVVYGIVPIIVSSATGGD